MTSYTNVFGGNAVRPADQSLSRITLSANTTLVWPKDGGSPATSAIIEVDATAGSLTLRLPDARNASEGETITFRNTGANTFSVLDNASGSVATITTGNVITVYLSDNSTAAGLWSFWQAGAGSATVSADAIDGAGLDASGGLLRVRARVQSYNASAAFSDSNRGSVATWTGGSGTFSMPLSASVGNGWYMIFKNRGTGTLQIASTGGETFDGATDITLSPGEGATIYSDSTNFSFVLYGSSSSGSSFDYTSIAVPGTGSYTLSPTEYARNALRFTGILTGNRKIIVPVTVRDYWVDNSTTGAYTLSVETLAGTGVTVTQGKRAILYCDGTDVVDSDNDYPAGISLPVAVANGGTGSTTASAARTALGSTTIGDQLFTATDSASARSAISAPGLGVTNSFSGSNTFTGTHTIAASSGSTRARVQSPSTSTGKYHSYQTIGSTRWETGGNSTAESGSNSGSDYVINRHDDAGTYIDTPLQIFRNTGQVYIRDLDLMGSLSVSNGGTGSTNGVLGIANLEGNGYTSVTSSGGTTALTASSATRLLVTGSTSHTVTLPDVTTLVRGVRYTIIGGTSTTGIQINTFSGANKILCQPGVIIDMECISTSDNTAAGWVYNIVGSYSDYTGSGMLVFQTDPQMTNLNLTSNNGLSAGANTQGTTNLTFNVQNITSTATNPSAVTLPTASSSFRSRPMIIRNGGTNPLNVYPASGHQIDALGTNSPFSIPVGGIMIFFSINITQWYSLSYMGFGSARELTVTGTGGLGYGTGAGGTVTQATSKSTGVTINKHTGRIIMHNATLTAGSSAWFQVTNSVVGANDTIILHPSWNVGMVEQHEVTIGSVGAGLFNVVVWNRSGSSSNVALEMSFSVIKGVNA